jgi:hypothetical protein
MGVMNIMLSNNRHWLECHSVALLAVLTGLGLVGLIVLSI